MTERESQVSRPSAAPDKLEKATEVRAARPAQGARVRRERSHIKALTGRDPLRGGIDD